MDLAEVSLDVACPDSLAAPRLPDSVDGRLWTGPDQLTQRLGARAREFAPEQVAAGLAWHAWQRRQYLADSRDSGVFAGLGVVFSVTADGCLACCREQTRPAVRDWWWRCTAQGPVTSGHTTALLAWICAHRSESQFSDLSAPADWSLLKTDGCRAPESWQRLASGEAMALFRDTGTAEWRPADGAGRAVLAGSFNPLHQGHRQMIAVAQQRLQARVELEISLLNVDKPPLCYAELKRRVRSLKSHPLWLTRAATFAEKCRLFPGSTLIVGLDTMVRILDARYAATRPEADWKAFAEQDVRFLVFGRKHAGRFQTLKDLDLPAPLRERCTAVAAEDFRVDLSSSQLRG